MELKAVREYINQSQFRDWYCERNVTMNLPYQRLEFSLKGESDNMEMPGIIIDKLK